MPPGKHEEDGQVGYHSIYTPMSTPIAFVGPNVVCGVAGSSVYLWNILDGHRDFIHTSVYAITKLCGDPTRGLLAFCEGGTSPQVFVYSVDPPELLFTLPDITELELADLAFSHCGSRLYTLSRAAAKRLCVFSTSMDAETTKLKGCELDLPLRFDKISVYPGHKDHLALVRSSSVRIVSIQKSHETYITRLLPAAVPADADISVSAYAWTAGGQFAFATRQGTLCTLDGSTGALLHVCQVEQAITSIAVTMHHFVTAHLGNAVRFWSLDTHQLLNIEHDVQFSNASPMESNSVYTLQKVAEIESFGQGQQIGTKLLGQIAGIQITPDTSTGLMTTAEGEIWAFRLPNPQLEATVAEALQDAEAVEPDVSMKAEDLQMEFLSWYHTHSVSAAMFLGVHSRIGASVDEGGRFRIWEVSKALDPKGFRVLRFSSALTSMTADDHGKVVVLGSDSGCLHLVDSLYWRRPQVLDSLRVSSAGVAGLSSFTHEGRSLTVAAALFNHKIAFLSVVFADLKLCMLGFVDLLGSVEHMSFQNKDPEQEPTAPPKLIAVGASRDHPWTCLWAVRAPPLNHDPVVAELKRDVCPVWSTKLSADRKPEGTPTALSPLGQMAVVVGFADGAIRSYPLPTNPGLPTARLAPGQAVDSYAPHDQLITCLRVSQDGAGLISASMDGSVRRSSLDCSDRGAEFLKIVHNPYSGGASLVCLSNSGNLLLSTGGTDGVLVWSGSAEADMGDPHHVEGEEEDEEDEDEEAGVMDDDELNIDIDDTDTTAYPIWAPTTAAEKAQMAQAAQDDPEINAVALAQRRALALEVEGLRRKLRALVEQNTTCPELEQLDRNEFCVDIEERNAIAAKTKERCDILRAQIERENLARQLIRDRLVKEFWDPMRSKGCQICSLMSNFSVSNYPERIVSDEEESTLRKLRNIRRVEQLEEQMLSGKDCPDGLRDDVVLRTEPFTTGKEMYVVNWWPPNSIAKRAAKAEAKDEGNDNERRDTARGSEALPTGVEIIASGNQRLLYEPFELLTNSRRRLQIYLLQSLAADHRAAFNELFKVCQSDKRNIMDGIREKITRIRAILGELQIEEKVPEPELQDCEDADSVLQVKDKEITAEKWISEEERQRIAEAEAREQERLRQLRENDAGQRALQQMMGGTLKTKKDLSALEITLDREPWMDQIPLEDMTDLQKQALKEFEEKEKALAEEQDKYRKQLDAELKKLRSEVQDLTQQFETILKELHRQRFAHDAKFFCQELYCVRLQLALLQNVEDSHVLKQSMQDVDEAQAKLTVCDDQLAAFNEKVSLMRDKQDERSRYEREVASAQHFRQQFAQSGLEPEQITSLLHIFRRRRDAPRESVRGSVRDPTKTSVAAHSSLRPIDENAAADPYPDLGTVPETDHDQAFQEEDNMDDCPPGVDELNMKRMIELKKDRLQAELDVQKGSAVFEEMKKLLAHYQKERDDASAAHDQLQAELAGHLQLMDRELFDIEILFKLKQGQVEVPQAAVVTDYSDAVVIDKEVVESRNRRILELGKDKVGTLETIKEFRKKLSLIQWEHRMLALQTSDLEERTKDVHMLRVTKGLQSLLKGGEEGRNKADADLLERKIEHLNTTTQQKEQSLKKQYAMGSHATKLRKMENSMLEKKLRELQQNVIQREHIRRLRAPQGGATNTIGNKAGDKPRIVGGGGRIEENEGVIRAAQTNFREVRARQGLMDAAKRHTEEIDLLRKELDRLRQKTFPSFVQLHEERPSNPDHIG